jgi:hypothetical protein
MIFPTVLLRNATLPYNQFLTQAERALATPPKIVGLTPRGYKAKLPRDAAINQAGETAIANIMSQVIRSVVTVRRFGSVIEYQPPNGFGARFHGPGSENPGEFTGFINP